MKYLIGIDDTGTTRLKGTSSHARLLAIQLGEAGLGAVHGITRHQHYIHPAIRYTSNNSSACLLVETGNYDEMKMFCRNFIRETAAPLSCAGMCIAREDDIPRLVLKWGNRAKYELLDKNEAREIVGKFGIYLEGINGTHEGIIGALAAVGLRKNGNDGRLTWLKKKKELRELIPGFYAPQELKEDYGIEQILVRLEKPYLGERKIYVHDWFRPVMKYGKITLIIEKFTDQGETKWKAADKDYICSHS
jgi:hypothetical protein